jgi:putative ATP-dependent endonuclease of the OLD family
VFHPEFWYRRKRTVAGPRAALRRSAKTIDDRMGAFFRKFLAKPAMARFEHLTLVKSQGGLAAGVTRRAWVRSEEWRNTLRTSALRPKDTATACNALAIQSKAEQDRLFVSEVVMRLQTIILKNFRSFKNETISLAPYTSIVGPNNSGKSTIFRAIDIFFRTSQRSSPLAITDFNDPKEELQIDLTFGDLPKEPLQGFEHYQRHGTLEFFIKAKNDGGEIEASIHGKRKGIRNFAGFFGGTAAERKEFYGTLRSGKYADLPAVAARSPIAAFESALHEYEASHPEQHELIESEDLAFGTAGVVSRLNRYIDWIYIPAVKDATDEDEEARNTAFGVLVNRLIRSRVNVEAKISEIQEIAHEKVESLTKEYQAEVQNVEKALDQEFRRMTSANAHVHLDWAEVGEENISLQLPIVKSQFSDETFRGQISQFGHGLQRNYLMALVHINATFALEEEKSVIIACEEPELYQHPPQARYLNIALQKISEKDQVLVTSHSPYFISARNFENIRVIRKQKEAHSRVSHWTADEHRGLIAKARGEHPIGEMATLAKLDQFIQPELSEAFFCGKLVLVEGLEDRAILTTALAAAGLEEAFARSGGFILGVNGKGGLVNMIAIARGFEIPYFVMFDADTGCDAGQAKNSKKLNSTILKLSGFDAEEYVWPDTNVFLDRVVIWSKDIQSAMAGEYPQWFDDVKAVCAQFGGNYEPLKKNPAVLGHALQAAINSGTKFECLAKVVDKVLRFSES